jgi:hypothetical protein
MAPELRARTRAPAPPPIICGRPRGVPARTCPKPLGSNGPAPTLPAAASTCTRRLLLIGARLEPGPASRPILPQCPPMWCIPNPPRRLTCPLSWQFVHICTLIALVPVRAHTPPCAGL